MASDKFDSRRSEIGLADLVLAMKKLGYAEHDLLSRYFQCLGFSHHPQKPTPGTDYRSNQAAWNRTRFRSKQSPTATVKYTPSVSMPPVPESTSELPEQTLDSGFEDLGIETTNHQDSFIPEKISQANAITLAEDLPPPVKRASLFPTSKARAVITEVVSQSTAGRDLDVHRLIAAAVQQKPLKKLPILPSISTRNGCQLLIDMNEALMPWWPDMQDLVKQFHSLLGEAACPVYEFEHDPFLATHWNEQQGEIAWKCVAHTPVIVATDLGVRKTPDLSLRTGLDTWKQFTTYCQRRQAPLIALVPINPTRWPKGLQSGMHIIHWNPATNAAIVKRLQQGNR